MEHASFFVLLMPGRELERPRREAEDFQRVFAREADRFAQRLALYSEGEIAYERSEVVDFWSQIMSEHAAFIAHLLDPQEETLIGQAEKLQAAFANTSGLSAVESDPVFDAAEEILDFKTVGEKGIRSGMIKSIIRPELAAHVRREAVRFIDELKRTRMTV